MINYIKSKWLNQNITQTIIVSYILQGAGIITGILTARLLGPENKGELTAIILWPTFLTAVGTFGIANSITYISARFPDESEKVLSLGFLFGAIQSVFLIAIGMITIPLLLKNYTWETIRLSLYYLSFIPISIFTLYQQSYLAARFNFKAFNIVRLMIGISILVGIIYLSIINRLIVANIVFVYFIGNISALVTATYWIIHDYRPRIKFAKSHIKLMVSYGFKSYLSDLSQVVGERLDQLIISIHLAPYQLGQYVVASTFITPVVLIGTSNSMVAMPTIAATHIGGQIDSYCRYIRRTLWLSFGLAIILLFTLPLLIRVLFGNEYVDALTPARILVVSSIFIGGNRVIQAGLKALNRPIISGIGGIIAVVLSLILLFFLLPTYGIIGASVASLITNVLLCVSLIAYLFQSYDFSIQKILFLQPEDKEEIIKNFNVIRNRIHW